MREWENELSEDPEISEEQMERLFKERLEEVETQIEQDEYPPEPETDEQPERKKLKRELRAEALTRLEDAARTEDDFQKIVDWWDRLDANLNRALTKQIQKQLLTVIQEKVAEKQPLTREETVFLSENNKTTLDGGKSG